MKVFTLQTTTLLPCSMNEAWEFFSTPLNLNRITPPDMSFEILNDIQGVKMYPGMVIHYKVRPLFNIPLRWTTEITHCEEGKYFVDEQRFGPYAFWHHQHHFDATPNGVKMTDTVNYAIGFGFIGSIANAIYVDTRLKQIFAFRETVIGDIFKKK